MNVQAPIRANNFSIAELDPLQADEVLGSLPEMNLNSDVNALITALRAISPTVSEASALSPPQAAAAMRDIGMFLASIKRHGKEPLDVLPELAAVLKILGDSCQMVPRETVYHYGPWNPRGRRQRLFLRDKREEILIESTRLSAPACIRAGEDLFRASKSELDSLDFIERCHRASQQLMIVVNAFQTVRQEVDALFFAQQLRPYFEDISIAGSRYSGPAAAALPLGVIDHFLWSSDCRDREYRQFHEHLLKHGLPNANRIVHETAGSASITSRITSEISDRISLKNAIDGVHELFTLLLRFRGKHKTIADEAYAPAVRLYSLGSGGFGTEALGHVLALTRESALKIRTRIVTGDRIGDLLVASGAATRGEVEDAEKEGKRRGRRLSDILLEQGTISDLEITAQVEAQLQVRNLSKTDSTGRGTRK